MHSYSVLTTHFHFLVESPIGEMSEAFRRAQNAHSRRFNRRRRRDGALVRGRFFSKPVRDDRYRRVLVRYIDHNPVRAGIVNHAFDHEFSSASRYARGNGTPWLERSWVEARCRRGSETGQLSPSSYLDAFPPPGSSLIDWVDRRQVCRASTDPLTDLVGSAPSSVRHWMERKARLADGHRLGLPVCALEDLTDSLDVDESESGTWIVQDGDRVARGREPCLVGFGRELAGLTMRELGERVDKTPMQLRRLWELHRLLVARDSDYAARASKVASRALLSALGEA